MEVGFQRVSKQRSRIVKQHLHVGNPASTRLQDGEFNDATRRAGTPVGLAHFLAFWRRNSGLRRRETPPLATQSCRFSRGRRRKRGKPVGGLGHRPV